MAAPQHVPGLGTQPCLLRGDEKEQRHRACAGTRSATTFSWSTATSHHTNRDIFRDAALCSNAAPACPTPGAGYAGRAQCQQCALPPALPLQ